MYVFPRAGNPTMDITVGLLMTLGHDAENIYYKHSDVMVDWLVGLSLWHNVTHWRRKQIESEGLHLSEIIDKKKK